ncbi:MAG: lipase maturation factor family protein [Myxococcales bacterium]|nr:lipase maturation factor family protein [Myxococcales bacterium]MDD9971629.1 lipase maturation factor family protein [Myxococcales bacterium]
MRRFFEHPTLLWVLRSDRALRTLPIAGVLCGLAAVYGGTPGFVGLLLGWVLWLSLEPVGILYPWDTLLMEVGFLVLFLPEVAPLPNLAATELPLPTVAFMVRWLVLRLMLGFGKVKFVGIKPHDKLYLRGFFVWMPLPSPLGWFGHHAPTWFLKMAHMFMFVAEIAAPIMGLFTGLPRLVCYALMVLLMLGIQATGNWGFFNIGYILLCTCLLDVNSSVFEMAAAPWADTWTHWPDLAVHAIMAVLFSISLFYLIILDSWSTRAWVHWPVNLAGWPSAGARRAFAWVHRALSPLRPLAPFRFVNGYGVFPPHATPPLRLTPVFEGSDDGETWKQYGYKWMPAFANSRPPFLSPRHARLDQATYYFANGIHTASLFGSLFPRSWPHLAHARTSTFDIVAQRLLAGDPLHLNALGHNPFPDAPPKLIRVAMLALTPTRPQELRATGDWWHVRRLGTIAPPRGRETWPDELLYPPPELFHPDYSGFKRRAPALRAVLEAHARGAPPDEAILAGSDLTPADVDTFWNELIPLFVESKGDWSEVHTRARVVSDRFDVPALYRLERVLERYAWLARETIATHPEAGPATDALGLSNFRQHMLVHTWFLEGHDAVCRLIEQPTLFASRPNQPPDEIQLWVLTMMRYEQMMAHVAGFRWCEIGMRSYEMELPGLFEYFPFLSQVTPPDEDFWPQPVLHDSGEHTIEGFYPPPSLVQGK